MKILIIGPSWVGDMVMSQSLYRELKSRHPNATIDVLAPAWCAPILERMSEVDHAIEMPIGHGDFSLTKRWKIGRQLAASRYTHAFILPNSAKSALIPLFAGIPVRTGWKGEMRYGLLNDLRADRKVFQYMVERYVALAVPKSTMVDEVSLERCLKPKLRVDSDQQEQLRQRFSLSSDRKVVGLCPGAEFGPAKRWPAHHYAELASALIQAGKQIWLFGSQKDQEVTQHIRSLLPLEHQSHCFDLAGKTTLVEVVDLLACCHTVVSNDSGLMHVAAAVNCHIIAIYGSSSPQYTPPLAENVITLNTDIECRPCFQRECPYGHLNCLKQLTPDQVIRQIKHQQPK
ncbi:lipopolysaccharide heptosyltransferase II [Vibrio sp. MEBiC08052]|uniref:lipopolysaccharide heptosyltransferase II n=1 Tax=Vibrio sp. MEBiC08052 TaxID=1761910 RepID=UPI00074103BA|nr:lipopolysaccharide heptosyltransferase II [Vibrio sp. MEBiC08052]